MLQEWVENTGVLRGENCGAWSEIPEELLKKLCLKIITLKNKNKQKVKIKEIGNKEEAFKDITPTHVYITQSSLPHF